MLDIAIIGAGPVGLASAAALHQKLGADVKMQVLQIGLPSLRGTTALLSEVELTAGTFEHLGHGKLGCTSCIYFTQSAVLSELHSCTCSPHHS